MAKDNGKISSMKMPGQINVLTDMKPDEKVNSNNQKPLFNSHWRILGTPKKETN